MQKFDFLSLRYCLITSFRFDKMLFSPTTLPSFPLVPSSILVRPPLWFLPPEQWSFFDLYFFPETNESLRLVNTFSSFTKKASSNRYLFPCVMVSLFRSVRLFPYELYVRLLVWLACLSVYRNLFKGCEVTLAFA